MQASIREMGLKQNLLAHDMDGMFHVHAGGWRLAILQRLVEKNHIKLDSKIPGHSSRLAKYVGLEAYEAAGDVLPSIYSQIMSLSMMTVCAVKVCGFEIVKGQGRSQMRSSARIHE